jgi:hypothetical protein
MVSAVTKIIIIHKGINMKKYSILLVFIFLIGALLAGCATSAVTTITPTPKAKVIVKLAPTQTPTKEIAPTQTQAIPPTETAEKPTQVATLAGPLNTETPVSPAPLTESWRIPPMPEAQLIASDMTKDTPQNILDLMNMQARNLSIPKGYKFEFYALPKTDGFNEVKKYYDEQITKIGMRKAMDDVGLRGIALITWISMSNKAQKYAVQFNPGKDYNYTFILYSNPQ